MTEKKSEKRIQDGFKKGVDLERSTDARHMLRDALRTEAKTALMNKKRAPESEGAMVVHPDSYLQNFGENDRALREACLAFISRCAQTGPINAEGQTDFAVVAEQLKDALDVSANHPQFVPIVCDIIPSLIGCFNAEKFATILDQGAALSMLAVLQNISAGSSTECKALVEHRIVETLTPWLECKVPFIVSKIVEIFSNILIEMDTYRPAMFDKMLPKLVQFATQYDPNDSDGMLQRAAVQMLSTLANHKEAPSSEQVYAMFGVFRQLIFSSDAEIRANSVWGMWCLGVFEGRQFSHIYQNLSVDEIAKIITFLAPDDLSDIVKIDTRRYAVKLFGTMAYYGTEESNDMLRKLGILPALIPVLHLERYYILTICEALWMLTNLAGDSQTSLDDVANAGMFEALTTMPTRKEASIRRDVCTFYCKCADVADDTHMNMLLKKCMLDQIEKGMRYPTTEHSRMVLASLKRIVDAGIRHADTKTGISPVAQMIAATGICNGLRFLERSADNITAEMATELYEKLEGAEDIVMEDGSDSTRATYEFDSSVSGFFRTEAEMQGHWAAIAELVKQNNNNNNNNNNMQ